MGRVTASTTFDTGTARHYTTQHDMVCHYTTHFSVLQQHRGRLGLFANFNQIGIVLPVSVSILAKNTTTTTTYGTDDCVNLKSVNR
mmetsp:Transcript_11014/g.26222  ORF Transcript_11014/g.26222 Transcript_11014/m.26222 type:complete len:86 (+) Transcript_11014:71-328(+)